MDVPDSHRKPIAASFIHKALRFRHFCESLPRDEQFIVGRQRSCFVAKHGAEFGLTGDPSPVCQIYHLAGSGDIFVQQQS